MAWATMSWSSRAIPRTLLGHGDPRCRLSLPLGENRAHLSRLAFPLGEGRAHLGRLGLHGTLAQGVAGDPGDDEAKRNEDELAGCLGTRDVGNHDHDGPQHHGEADSRLPLVAQVSEQERGCQPDHAEAPDERDQQPVDERERGGQEPVGDGGREGKAPTREER